MILLTQFSREAAFWKSAKACARRGFTMTELVVVIAIVVVLVSLLFPLLNTAQTRMKETRCANNLRVLGTAFRLFAAEHDNRLPMSYVIGSDTPDNNWWYRLSSYAGVKMNADWYSIGTLSMRDPYHCPDVKYPDAKIGGNAWVSYKMNEQFRRVLETTRGGGNPVGDMGFPLSIITNPEEILLLAEGRKHCEFNTPETNDIAWGLWYPHGGRMNGLFVDGHVEAMAYAQLKARWDDCFWVVP